MLLLYQPLTSFVYSIDTIQQTIQMMTQLIQGHSEKVNQYYDVNTNTFLQHHDQKQQHQRHHDVHQHEYDHEEDGMEMGLPLFEKKKKRRKEEEGQTTEGRQRKP